LGDGRVVTTSSTRPADLTLQLLLRPGEPLTGVLRVGCDDAAVEFCGWLELIAAITLVREDHSER